MPEIVNFTWQKLSDAKNMNTGYQHKPNSHMQNNWEPQNCFQHFSVLVVQLYFTANPALLTVANRFGSTTLLLTVANRFGSASLLYCCQRFLIVSLYYHKTVENEETDRWLVFWLQYRTFPFWERIYQMKRHMQTI
jgi:hypothetical protein